MFEQDPDHIVGFLLHDVSRLMRKRFDQRARAVGLTRAQWRVLVHLGPRQGINQTTLAEILELDSVSLGRHIDRLAETGWLERRPDPTDRRAWQLYLSAKARPILDSMEELAIETQREALVDIPGAEQERLMATLRSIKANMLEAELHNPLSDSGSESGDGTVADAPARRRANHGR